MRCVVLVDGRGRLELDVPARDGKAAPTVADAFAELRGSHPALYDRIFTERRELRPHVNVFVGRDDIRWAHGFRTPVPDGQEMVVLPSVSGG